uniref:Shufflon protein A n=1 Tax=Klebsiella pneumoniae TaxID=573 RepID=A0A8D6XSA4_KLEPN
MGNLMKKYDRGWASLEIGAALLIVMIIVAWGAGIWQDYLKTKGWQAEARLVSNWASAARSYIGKTTQLSRPVVPQQPLPLSRQPC